MTGQLVPPLAWPDELPAYGGVVLRAFEDRDVPMVRDLATDPYLPDIGSLARDADEAEARAYVERNRGRHVRERRAGGGVRRGPTGPLNANSPDTRALGGNPVGRRAD